MKKIAIIASLLVFTTGTIYGAAAEAPERMKVAIEELFVMPEALEKADAKVLIGEAIGKKEKKRMAKMIKRAAKMEKRSDKEKEKALKILSKLKGLGGPEAVAKLEERFNEKKAAIEYRLGTQLARRLARIVEDLKEETVTTKDFAEAIAAVRQNNGGFGGGKMRGHFGGKGGKMLMTKSAASRKEKKVAHQTKKLLDVLTGRIRKAFMMKHMGSIKKDLHEGDINVLYVIAGKYKELLTVPTDSQVKKEHPFISADARKELIDEVPQMHAALDASIATIRAQLAGDTAPETPAAAAPTPPATTTPPTTGE